MGTSRCHIALTLNTQKSYIGFEIYIRNDKSLYDTFYKNKDKIEAAIGSELEWMELPDAIASRILVTLKTNPKDRKSWNESFEWCTRFVDLFSQTFKQYINY